MFYPKLLRRSLLILVVALAACSQTQASTTPSRSPQTPSQPSSQASAQPPATTPASTPAAQKNKESNRQQQAKGRQIGQLIDCDRDGRDDDARMDNDNDGVPDECMLGTEDAGTETIAESTPEPEIEPAIFDPADIAADYHQKMETLTRQPCDRLSKTEDGVVYSICTIDEGGGDARILSASSASQEAGDGVEYWYVETGKVYGIRFFHTGQTFIFDPEEGRLKVQLLSANEIETEFSPEMRSRMEAMAIEANGMNPIFEKFRGETE
jgi:hypothetical protein